MRRSEQAKASPQPSKPRGLFSPECAMCGTDKFQTVSSKYRPASAGFCPSCGVFVCFECASDEGLWGWKQTCPACRKRLRTNTLVFFGAYMGGMFTIFNTIFARWDAQTMFCISSFLWMFFAVSSWILLNRYSSHRLRMGDWRGRMWSRSQRSGETLVVEPESVSTVEALKERY